MEIVSHSQTNNGLTKRKTMFLVFGSKKERDSVYNTMLKIVGSDCITTE